MTSKWSKIKNEVKDLLEGAALWLVIYGGLDYIASKVSMYYPESTLTEHLDTAALISSILIYESLRDVIRRKKKLQNRRENYDKPEYYTYDKMFKKY